MFRTFAKIVYTLISWSHLSDDFLSRLYYFTYQMYDVYHVRGKLTRRNLKYVLQQQECQSVKSSS